MGTTPPITTNNPQNTRSTKPDQATLYLRNRVKTRWRDAGIGLLVFSLVLLGIQTEQYLRLSDQQSQAQLLVGFIEGVAIDHGVQASDVMVN